MTKQKPREGDQPSLFDSDGSARRPLRDRLAGEDPHPPPAEAVPPPTPDSGSHTLDELDHPDNFGKLPIQALRPCAVCDGSGMMPDGDGDGEEVPCLFC